MTRLRILAFLCCFAEFPCCDAAVFQVDTAGSAAFFEVGYFGSGVVKGALGHMAGPVEFDDASKSGVADIRFDMRMVETGNGIINAFIRSKRIFDTDTYPSMRFHSSQFEFQGDQMTAVKGELTLHGVTKPVVMDVKKFACGDTVIADRTRYQCAGDFYTTILRSDFGMTSFSAMVDDEVRITVQLILERQIP